MALPHRLHAATPAELSERLEAERRGEPFLLYRDPAGGQHIIGLEAAGPRVRIGRQAELDVALPWDVEVSRVHAELERIGQEWTILDEGSRNGSFVNEERLHGRRRLGDGDVVRVGATSLVFFSPRDRASDRTAPARGAAAPLVSPAQHRVLVALCRPLAPGGPGVPATNRRIAEELYVTVETVKTHLKALFEAFDLEDLPQNEKRGTLARLAIERGVVAPHELIAEAR